MADHIVREVIREVRPLLDTDPVGYAARRVIEAGLPALPVVDEDGHYAGLFGEREFMTAVFPGYVGTLMSARMIRRSLDETIERRLEDHIGEHDQRRPGDLFASLQDGMRLP